MLPEVADLMSDRVRDLAKVAGHVALHRKTMNFMAESFRRTFRRVFTAFHGKRSLGFVRRFSFASSSCYFGRGQAEKILL